MVILTKQLFGVLINIHFGLLRIFYAFVWGGDMLQMLERVQHGWFWQSLVKNLVRIRIWIYCVMLSLVLCWCGWAIVQILFWVFPHILSVYEELASIFKVTSVIIGEKSILLWWLRRELPIIHIVHVIRSSEGSLIELIASLWKLIQVQGATILWKDMLCLIKFRLGWLLFLD